MVVILDLPLPRSKPIVFENFFEQIDDALSSPLNNITSSRNNMISLLQQDSLEPALKALENYLPYLLSIKDSVQQLIVKSPALFFWTSPISVNFRNSFYSCNSIQLEILMVYNAIAICHRNIARKLLMEAISPENVKFETNTREAANHLCIAAGIFEHIHSTHTSFVWNSDFSEALPEKMPEVFLAFENICLAEAQQVAIHKAAINGTSSGLISKLCTDSFKKLEYAESLLRGTKKQTPGLRSLEPFHLQEALWMYLSLKKRLCESYALKYLALQSNHDMKYGLGIVYTQLALKKLTVDNVATCSNTIVEVVKTINVTKGNLVKQLRTYKTENSTIYFDHVPSEESVELPTQVKSVVKIVPFQPPSFQPITLTLKPGNSCSIM
eukprot:TRINITY_DN15848_c0_g1_i1.p1 TRINITY_DN15848_c0_g1~~TRINITY_DN15848_c0_g1_i1.p1  ORF type:complete len:383 (-),score=49.39 TRINITY_DN15848_c0_g1_i1:20-1168(-)